MVVQLQSVLGFICWRFPSPLNVPIFFSFLLWGFFLIFLILLFLSFIMGEGRVFVVLFLGYFSTLLFYTSWKRLLILFIFINFLSMKMFVSDKKISLAFAIQGLVSLCDGVITALSAINVKMQDTCVRYVKTIVMIFFSVLTVNANA